jgi:hypothetical protein
VVAGQAEVAVHRLPHVQLWQDVQRRQAGDGLGVVEGQTVADQRPVVMADDGEPVVAQRGHQLAHVGGHDPLGVALVARVAGRLVTVAVAAQVGADHGEPLGQRWRNRVPGDMGLRVAVQQDHRRAVAGHGGLQHHLSRLDTPAGEPGQQRHQDLVPHAPGVSPAG